MLMMIMIIYVVVRCEAMNKDSKTEQLAMKLVCVRNRITVIAQFDRGLTYPTMVQECLQDS